MKTTTITIEIQRHKECGHDASYDLIAAYDKNKEEGDVKTICFDKEELLEKVAEYISKSFHKD